MADRGFVEQFVQHPTFQDDLKKSVQGGNVREKIRRTLLLAVEMPFYVIGAFVIMMLFTFQWIGLYLIWAGFVDWLTHHDMRFGFPIFLSGIPLALISVGLFLTRAFRFIENRGA